MYAGLGANGVASGTLFLRAGYQFGTWWLQTEHGLLFRVDKVLWCAQAIAIAKSIGKDEVTAKSPPVSVGRRGTARVSCLYTAASDTASIKLLRASADITPSVNLWYRWFQVDPKILKEVEKAEAEMKHETMTEEAYASGKEAVSMDGTKTKKVKRPDGDEVFKALKPARLSAPKTTA
eukprot:2355696-Rhodomonas_salina.4